MPPKRTRNNVDDIDNEEESDIKTIRIVSPNSKKGARFMCELCSSILKSAASLDRHKKSKHGSDDKYICSDCGVSSKTRIEHNNHKRKHKTSYCNVW